MSNTSRIRVLFVDDEPLVLQGLQRMFRPMRSEWEMAFVESGHAALLRLAEVPFQVIVTDMRMPGMNGAQLLSEVRQHYPETVRLILSGHADKDLIMKCVGTAHQFLAKPCEPEALRSAIARGCAFDSVVENERMRQLIGRMDCLPSVPSILNEITERLAQDDCAIEEIGRIISKDLGMTAKLLKLVNSAFFGLRRTVSSPDEAVSHLGVSTIKALVLAVNAFAPFETRGGGSISVESIWAHSLEVASVAREIAVEVGGTKKEVSEAFVAGLLHDVGKLALIANVPDEYEAVVQRSRAKEIPLHVVELEVFGADHGGIGGYLLNLWGLPDSVVSAICFHHQPRSARAHAGPAVLAVHAADAICRFRRDPEEPELLDQNFIAEAGYSDRLTAWRNLSHDEQNPTC